jgi:phosphonate transport system substrate-binding protein
MDKIRITSLQAPNQDFIIQGLATYLQEQIGIPVEFREDIHWREREILFDRGEIDIAWMCGLYYIDRISRDRPTMQLLAAPVMRGSRYEKLPVYFSDVMVRKDSPFVTFADLRGARWAYNEPNSHSGYNITRYVLAELGERQGYFSQVIEAGSHQASLEMILDGRVDAAAIDSTVLEIQQKTDDRLGTELRRIAIFGPSPIPPLTISRLVVEKSLENIQSALISMHENPTGYDILMRGNIDRYVPVSDRDYVPIREMALIAQQVTL